MVKMYTPLHVIYAVEVIKFYRCESHKFLTSSIQNLIRSIASLVFMVGIGQHLFANQVYLTKAV